MAQSSCTVEAIAHGGRQRERKSTQTSAWSASKAFKSTVAFKDVVKVAANDPATWPVEIRGHPDIQSRYIASFQDELAGRPSWITLIVPESIRPVGYELICMPPRNPPPGFFADAKLSTMFARPPGQRWQ